MVFCHVYASAVVRYFNANFKIISTEREKYYVVGFSIKGKGEIGSDGMSHLLLILT